MPSYKVWAEIEEWPDGGGDPRSLTPDDGVEPVPIGEFDTLEEADRFVSGLSIDGAGPRPWEKKEVSSA